MLTDGIVWLDASPLRYWTGAVLTLLALFYLVVRAWRRALSEAGTSFRTNPPTQLRLLDSPWLFFSLATLTILAFRWPIFFFPYGLNPDEATMGAQAMKYFTDIVPWRSVDGTTSGPLNAWILMIPGLLGFELSLASGRFIGFVCVGGIIGFLYFALRKLGSDFEARLATLVATLFFAFTQNWDLTHYSSEHVPILLMAGGVYFGIRGLRGPTIRPGRLAVAALLFGSLPFAKLQAGPVGFVGVLALVAATRIKAREWRSIRIAVAGCLVGGLTVPALIMGTVAACGALEDFTISYLGLFNHHERFMMPFEKMRHFFTVSHQMAAFLLGALIVSLFSIVFLWRRQGREMFGSRRFLFWAAGFLLLCIGIVFKAGNSYPHYALFFVFPTALFCGTLLMEVNRRLREAPILSTSSRMATTLAALLFVAAFGIFQIPLKLHSAPKFQFLGKYLDNRDVVSSPLVKTIKELAPRGERMVIWGWSPIFYLETGLIPGTRETIAQMSMFDYPNQKYYRARFLADMMESNPLVFADTDSSIFPPHKVLNRYGHEKFPELAAHVARNYDLVQTLPVPDLEGQRLRLYLRKDR
jgi:hypothetical protein